MKNATIKTSLGNLLEVLDAKANIDIFEAKDFDTFVNPVYELFRSDKVYKILADTEFIAKYEYYRVTGVSIALGKVSVSIVNNEIFDRADM